MSEVISEPVSQTAELGYEGGPPPEPAPVVEEPAWQGPSQEEWEQTQNALAYFNQQLQPPEPQGEQYPQIDPFADNYGEQLAQFMQAQFQQYMTPFQEWVQSQQLGEAEERALDILDDITSREGEFLVQDDAYAQIRARANDFLNEEAQKHGFGPKAAEAALHRAAAEQREYERKIGEAYYARKTNQLKTLTGNPGEPATTYSQGSQERVMPNYREGGSVAGRIFGGN